jgi:predicted CXXCH cytochrome family protein
MHDYCIKQPPKYYNNSMKSFVKGFMVLFFLGQVQTAFPDVPDIKKDCSICHVVKKGLAGVLLIRPLPELCTECHPDRTGREEHSIGIKPAGTMTNNLPLDKQGKITCTTCHAPHGEGGFPKMLRKKADEICISCHKK